jgi:hypothetical protein
VGEIRRETESFGGLPLCDAARLDCLEDILHLSINGTAHSKLGGGVCGCVSGRVRVAPFV